MKKMVWFFLLFSLVPLLTFGDWAPPPAPSSGPSYEEITREDIVRYQSSLTDAPITYRKGKYTSLMDHAGHFDDVLKPGTIIFFQTDEGRYGKMIILAYSVAHGLSRYFGYQYFDIPFFLFTVYNDDGSIFGQQTEAPPLTFIPQSREGFIVYPSRRVTAWVLFGMGMFLLFPSQDNPPPGTAVMLLYFDFDTNSADFQSFSGADVYNLKDEYKSRFYPKNGAKMFVVYKP
ncbi:MAG TPA: hypothetical protein P5560_05245 [Thermotogota bacterium]|nr:hypothetical protein [Thermotogota bacterium]HRW92343.1 hypothetical protein [Thermotogota bacterium]